MYQEKEAIPDLGETGYLKKPLVPYDWQLWDLKYPLVLTKGNSHVFIFIYYKNSYFKKNSRGYFLNYLKCFTWIFNYWRCPIIWGRMCAYFYTHIYKDKNLYICLHSFVKILIHTQRFRLLSPSHTCS
jgi:hypothetical protein